MLRRRSLSQGSLPLQNDDFHPSMPPYKNYLPLATITNAQNIQNTETFENISKEVTQNKPDKNIERKSLSSTSTEMISSSKSDTELDNFRKTFSSKIRLYETFHLLNSCTF